MAPTRNLEKRISLWSLNTQKVNGAKQVASGGSRGPCDLTTDFQTWQQSTAAQKHTDTLNALLQLNHLLSLEEMTAKTQLWKNKAKHSILSVA